MCLLSFSFFTELLTELFSSVIQTVPNAYRHKKSAMTFCGPVLRKKGKDTPFYNKMVDFTTLHRNEGSPVDFSCSRNYALSSE